MQLSGCVSCVAGNLGINDAPKIRELAQASVAAYRFDRDGDFGGFVFEKREYAIGSLFNQAVSKVVVKLIFSLSFIPPLDCRL